MRRIAVVEDNADNRLLVEAILDGRYALAEYVSGPAALAGLLAEPPDLVLLDISLPDGSGWNLFDAMRAASRHPPVIVFSGSNVAQERLADVEGALVKAHSSDEVLVATIRRALGEP